MHDRGFCCHGDINSRLPAQTHNWVRIERWRGAVKIPLMKVEHQSCCRRLQSTHNQMKCLAERKRHNRTGLPTLVKSNRTFEKKLGDNFIYFYCYFILSHFLGRSFSAFFLYSKLVSVHLALILLFQAGIYPQSVQLPPNDGNQFSQEIRTSLTSEACSLRLIRPIWTADKSKRFLPLVPSPEIPLKICSCLLQSAPQFFYWCSLFWGRGGGGGGGIDKGMCSLGGVCGTGMVSVPWIKPSPFYPPSLPSPFTFSSGITNTEKSKNWWLAWSYLLVGEFFFLSSRWTRCQE